MRLMCPRSMPIHGTVVVPTSSNQVSINGGQLQMNSTVSNVIYDPSNFTTVGQQGTINFKWTPNFNTTSDLISLYDGSDQYNLIHIYYEYYAEQTGGISS